LIDSKILNTDKDYSKRSNILLGDERGLFDTVHNDYPEIWKLYKGMKALDWDANEFDYTSCANDFQTCDPSTYRLMIKTLAFQWEADSVAARTSPISGIFLTNDQAWAADQRISDNEVVHAETYSEIVRNSFKDPRVVMDEVAKIEESMQRLTTVSEVLSKSRTTALKYGLGLVENNQDTYNDAFMYYVALLALERIQFMSSFAVTFTICDTGLFQPIGKAVQKIAKDELKIHVEYRKELLRAEMKTERGKTAFQQCYDKICKLISEVDEGENFFIDYLFEDGDELTGSSPERLKAWKDWCVKDVYEFFDIKTDKVFPEKDPLPFLEKRWLKTGKTQVSPQEETGAYQVNVTKRNDAGITFDCDF